MLTISIVFGVDLVHLLQREQESEYIPPGTVPIVIEQCLAEVESRGLTEVGICKDDQPFSQTLLILVQIALQVPPRKSARSRMRTTEENTQSRRQQTSMLFVT